MKVALTGAVQLELLIPYFREAGFEIVGPDEIPDITYDVTTHDGVLEREVEGFYDERLKVLAGCPYSVKGIKAIVEEFKWEIFRRERGDTTCKILAVDADNTLWRGILSEDGKSSLEPYTEFQSGLQALAAEGTVLVLLSKNDPGSIDLDWFAVKKVNWEPKAGNLIEACQELNLSTDSVVFVDDNPHERAQMKSHLPEVMVAPWGGEPGAQLVRRLREYCFSGGAVTEEDRLRTADYKRRFSGKEEYLGDLGLWVEPRKAEERDLPRLVQMAGKTNQFNATTLRRNCEEFIALMNSPAHDVFVFRAGDKFGEQGIVLYIVIDLSNRRITDWVMSCRAMGRTLEYFAYNWLCRELSFVPEIDFVESPKNAPFRAFLSRITTEKQLVNYYREGGVYKGRKL